MTGQPLWTAQEIAKIFPSSFPPDNTGVSDWSANGVSIDSRTVDAGDLFVAIRGDRQDGHDYVKMALEKGAVKALVAQDAKIDDVDEVALLRVPDTLAGLQALGLAARDRMPGKVIAVTGSVGKTSVKEGLRQVLEVNGKTHASAASYNNLWGVPLSLARMPQDTEFAVFEIGMNHAGEITPLVAQVRPDIALITKIANAHIEHFDSLEAIAKAKAEIFSGLAGMKIALLPADSDWFAMLKQQAQQSGAAHIFGFGEAENADIRTISYKLHDHCSCISANVLGQAVAFRLGAPGQHLIANSMAILGVVHLLGADMTKAVLALGEMEALAGRGRRHDISLPGGDLLVIDESYNANPESMSAALSMLGQFVRLGQGRRIAVLGDMKELGPESAELHRQLVAPIEAADIDVVFTIGDEMRHLQDHLPAGRRGAHAKSVDHLIEYLSTELHGGDAIMIKGSNALGLGGLVSALTALNVSIPDKQEGGHG